MTITRDVFVAVASFKMLSSFLYFGILYFLGPEIMKNMFDSFCLGLDGGPILNHLPDWLEALQVSPAETWLTVYRRRLVIRVRRQDILDFENFGVKRDVASNKT